MLSIHMEPLKVKLQQLALFLSYRSSTEAFISLVLLPRRRDYMKTTFSNHITFEIWTANWCHISFPQANYISFFCWEPNWFWCHSHKWVFFIYQNVDMQGQQTSIYWQWQTREKKSACVISSCNPACFAHGRPSLILARARQRQERFCPKYAITFCLDTSKEDK